MADGTTAKGTRALLLLGAAGIVAAAGCASQRTEPARLLRTEDFVADRARSREVAQSPIPIDAAPGGEERGAEPGTLAPFTPMESQQAAQALPEVLDVGVSVGAPTPSGAAVPLEQPFLVDAKVGEINGRPIRADEVFQELGPRLAAMRRQPNISRARWLDDSRMLIRAWLQAVLEDQLLLAEARASLRPEQQMGLRHMVQDWSENLRRESGGSRAAAERRAEDANTTIRQMERDREAKILVAYQIEERIRKRVRVSWKDVRLYYDRNTDQSALARYRLIRVPSGNTEAIAAIQSALDGGQPFAVAASMRENSFRPEEGGLRTPDVQFTGDYESAELNLAPPLAAAARGLRPGQWTKEPVEQAGHQNWIFLENIERRGKPLSDRDVQLQIASRLNAAAMETERRAYIERLRERASFTDLDEMARRLAEIAAERFWPQG